MFNSFPNSYEYNAWQFFTKKIEAGIELEKDEKQKLGEILSKQKEITQLANSSLQQLRERQDFTGIAELYIKDIKDKLSLHSITKPYEVVKKHFSKIEAESVTKESPNYLMEKLFNINLSSKSSESSREGICYREKQMFLTSQLRDLNSEEIRHLFSQSQQFPLLKILVKELSENYAKWDLIVGEDIEKDNQFKARIEVQHSNLKLLSQLVDFLSTNENDREALAKVELDRKSLEDLQPFIQGKEAIGQSIANPHLKALLGNLISLLQTKMQKNKEQKSLKGVEIEELISQQAVKLKGSDIVTRSHLFNVARRAKSGAAQQKLVEINELIKKGEIKGALPSLNRVFKLKDHPELLTDLAKQEGAETAEEIKEWITKHQDETIAFFKQGKGKEEGAGFMEELIWQLSEIFGVSDLFVPTKRVELNSGEETLRGSLQIAQKGYFLRQYIDQQLNSSDLSSMEEQLPEVLNKLSELKINLYNEKTEEFNPDLIEQVIKNEKIKESLAKDIEALKVKLKEVSQANLLLKGSSETEIHGQIAKKKAELSLLETELKDVQRRYKYAYFMTKFLSYRLDKQKPSIEGLVELKKDLNLKNEIDEKKQLKNNLIKDIESQEAKLKEISEANLLLKGSSESEINEQLAKKKDELSKLETEQQRIIQSNHLNHKLILKIVKQEKVKDTLIEDIAKCRVALNKLPSESISLKEIIRGLVATIAFGMRDAHDNNIIIDPENQKCKFFDNTRDLSHSNGFVEWTGGKLWPSYTSGLVQLNEGYQFLKKADLKDVEKEINTYLRAFPSKNFQALRHNVDLYLKELIKPGKFLEAKTAFINFLTRLDKVKELKGVAGLILPHIQGLEEVNLSSHYSQVDKVIRRLLTIETQNKIPIEAFRHTLGKDPQLKNLPPGWLDMDLALGAMRERLENMAGAIKGNKIERLIDLIFVAIPQFKFAAAMHWIDCIQQDKTAINSIVEEDPDTINKWNAACNYHEQLSIFPAIGSRSLNDLLDICVKCQLSPKQIQEWCQDKDLSFEEIMFKIAEEFKKNEKEPKENKGEIYKRESKEIIETIGKEAKLDLKEVSREIAIADVFRGNVKNLNLPIHSLQNPELDISALNCWIEEDTSPLKQGLPSAFKLVTKDATGEILTPQILHYSFSKGEFTLKLEGEEKSMTFQEFVDRIQKKNKNPSIV